MSYKVTDAELNKLEKMASEVHGGGDLSGPEDFCDVVSRIKKRGRIRKRQRDELDIVEDYKRVTALPGGYPRSEY